MIHDVIDEVDRGDPIMIREVECHEGDTLEDLQNRIHSHEHQLIVEATAQVVKEISSNRSS
jgi:phosphoribosylglycinamide formyltransferase